jgi:hypothetical protein
MTLNNGATNKSMTKSGNYFNYTNSSIADGNYLARYYCNDTFGNLNGSVTTNFTVDTTKPVPSFVNPTNTTGTNLSSKIINYNVSVTEINLGSIIVYLYNTTRLKTSATATNNVAGSFGGLSEGIYTINASVNDSAGNINWTETRTYNLTSIAPAISSLSEGSITTSGAIITWTTDEVANSSLVYGKTTSYGSSGTGSLSLVTSHSITLNGLDAENLYYYNVTSCDASGNCVSSADTFTTIASDADDDDNGGSTTGGTVSYWLITSIADYATFKLGYTKVLAIKNRIRFKV